jgi:acetyltransferase-like isoleucine patch superfamily enzyme
MQGVNSLNGASNGAMPATPVCVRERDVRHKEPVLRSIATGRSSALRKYREFFVGKGGLVALARYELAALAGPLPGALGYLLRKWLYRRLCRRVGRGVQWGRNTVLRHPVKIEIGEGTGIDDDCLLDARGAPEDGFKIGDRVLIARGVVLRAKTGPLQIGDDSVIGGQCIVSSGGGVRIGSSVMIGGQSYIGGGRYVTDRTDVPIKEQGLYSNGPVEIADDVWIGTGARILDGVRIGRGAVIGAGAVIREDIPEYTVVTPYQKLVMVKRNRTDVPTASTESPLKG